VDPLVPLIELPLEPVVPALVAPAVLPVGEGVLEVDPVGDVLEPDDEPILALVRTQAFAFAELLELVVPLPLVPTAPPI
jgi:hypothetical protein